MAFLDAKTEHAETKLKNIIPFKNHSKTIATLRYKPGKASIGSVWGKKKSQNSDLKSGRRPKEMETYRVFMDLKTQHSKDIKSPHWLCRSIAIPIQILAWLFVERDKHIPHFIWKGTSPRIVFKTLAKKNKGL